jgi:hypothetical protein
VVDAYSDLVEPPQSYHGTVPRASTSVSLLARGTVLSFARFDLPGKSNGQLHLPSALTGIEGAQNSVSTNTAGIAGTVQHIEEVSIDAHRESVFYGNGFEKRGIQAPLPHTGKILLSPGMQPVTDEIGALHGAVVQWDPDRIGIPEGNQTSTRKVRRRRGAAHRNQGLAGRPVVGWYSHNAVRPSISVYAVDPIGRDVAVPPQITGAAGAGAAVLNRVLVAVNLDVITVRPDVRGQAEVIAPQRAKSRDLPASDDPVEQSVSAQIGSMRRAREPRTPRVIKKSLESDSHLCHIVHKCESFSSSKSSCLDTPDWKPLKLLDLEFAKSIPPPKGTRYIQSTRPQNSAVVFLTISSYLGERQE